VAAQEAVEESTVVLAAVQLAKVAAAEVHGNKQVDPVQQAQEEIQVKQEHILLAQKAVMLDLIPAEAVVVVLTVAVKVAMEEAATQLFVIR
jgi:hypothetical protein